ncbi:MAG TPA: quercetin 2,3-dioxygenase family protein [Gemmatirosa sp.]
MSDTAVLPGAPVPYVIRSGEGLSHLIAGQVVRTIARSPETNGGFGAVVCDAPLDRFPIPMHFHEREHDTWFCTRGKLQVWYGDGSRVLTPGDFAYVKPGDIHSYQSVAPRTQFFGVVAPGGWEDFFGDAGEVWGMTGLPTGGRPPDIPRIVAAQSKFRVMRVENPAYAAATPIGAADQRLPAGHDSYFLEAGFGLRRMLCGHLSTAVLTAAQCEGAVDMRVIEGGRDAAIPAVRHERTHQFFYVLDGLLAVTVDGEEHRLASGDAINLPAGIPYSTRVLSGSARWVATSSGGDAASMWDVAGAETSAFSFPIEGDPAADAARLRALTGVDVMLA